MIRDDLAEAVLARFDPKEIAPLRMAGHDHTFTMMRARQFDRQAQAFLDAHPDCVMVELGCGLDTRPARIDNGRRTWIGLDFPEVISLRTIAAASRAPRNAPRRIVDRSGLDGPGG